MTQTNHTKIKETAISIILQLRMGALSDYIIVDVTNKAVFSIFFSELLRRSNLKFTKHFDSFTIDEVTVILYNNRDENFPDCQAVVYFT